MLPNPARSIARRSLSLRGVHRVVGALVVGLAALLPGKGLAAQQIGIATRAEHLMAQMGAQDAGALAGSQSLTLSLRLASTPEQTAALDQLLLAQTNRSSPVYHRWLSTQEFGTKFGPTALQRQALTHWLSLNGLTVTAQSKSGMRLTVEGSVAAVEQAFAIPMRRMVASDQIYFANQTAPTLPTSLAASVSSISGLDDLPSPAATRLRLNGVAPAASADGAPAGSHAVQTSTGWSDEAAPSPSLAAGKGDGSGAGLSAWAAIEALVDNNLSPVVSLDSTLCADDLSATERADLRADLRQAQAQGITVLVAGSCEQEPALTFPSELAAVTAVTLAPAPMLTSDQASTLAEARPEWQAAPGLPADQQRYAPDLTTPSLAALAQTVNTLVRQTGARVGNLSPTLYALAKAPGLFTHAAPSGEVSAVGAGSWRPDTGLGTIDLQMLLKVYPRGVSSTTTTTLVSSSYALGYGDGFTLTSNVQAASYGATSPSGTVTFTSSSQGVIGTAVLSGGTATLTPDVLPVGVYSVTATYSGDGAYVGSTSTSKVTITISLVNAKVTASIAPQINVPYGATATVTATVMLPGANATPSTTVTAQIESVTGALYTATLSPNDGGNTATANIVISAPPPSTRAYTVQVSCLGTTNYQCQSPVNLLLGTVKGYTNTTISVTPASPQAGQPISLTATVANSGNGTGSYSYTGAIGFYDSGKLLASVPVATNQATTSVTLSGNRAHNIIAIYTGDTDWNASTSPAVAVTPTILPDLLTISSSVASGTSLAGVNIIFTGTATTSITYGVGPTGTITFFDTYNGAVIQLGNPAVMVPNGITASIGLFTTTGLLPGIHHIYAAYSGDDNYAAAQSPALQLSLSDFNVTLTPTSLNLSQGKSQQVSVLVGASGGFAGAVSLGCLPPSSSEATCSFAPSSVTGGGVTTLTIATTTASADLRHAAMKTKGAGRGDLAPGIAGGMSLATLFSLLLPRRSREALLRLGPHGLLCMLLAGTAILGSVGCGLGVLGNDGSGGNSSSGSGSSGGTTTGDAGTPLGSQNFTITAAASDGTNTVRHTYQYQVTVQ